LQQGAFKWTSASGGVAAEKFRTEAHTEASSGRPEIAMLHQALG
jgi:hypothetical protein